MYNTYKCKIILHVTLSLLTLLTNTKEAHISHLLQNKQPSSQYFNRRSESFIQILYRTYKYSGISRGTFGQSSRYKLDARTYIVRRNNTQFMVHRYIRVRHRETGQHLTNKGQWNLRPVYVHFRGQSHEKDAGNVTAKGKKLLITHSWYLWNRCK